MDEQMKRDLQLIISITQDYRGGPNADIGLMAIRYLAQTILRRGKEVEGRCKCEFTIGADHDLGCPKGGEQ